MNDPMDNTTPLDLYADQCIRAFHEARIEPADLKLFVGAVRLVHAELLFLSDRGTTIRVNVANALGVAAARLPENRKP